MNGRDPSGDAALRQELEHLRARLQVLVDGSPLGIFFDDAEDRCVYVNRTFCGMMELTFEEALGDGWTRTVHPEDLLWLMRERALAVRGRAEVFRAEYRYACSGGRTGWVEEQTRPVLGPAGKLLGYAGTLTESTWRKEAQREQERRTEELEDRVRERTAELREQTERLSEMNAALKVLLRQREEDRAELERVVLANVQSRIKPALDLLAGLGGEPRILDLLEDVRRGLRELTEPFCRRLSSASGSLTPSEIRVADLIRQGLTSKEIARRLGVGVSTVDSHRNHIRAKLGLHGRRPGLRTYLLSLQED